MSIDSATITKWVSAILTGIIIVLQGVNVAETRKVEADVHEVNRAIQEIHELHSELMTAMDRQKEILEILKAKQKP